MSITILNVDTLQTRYYAMVHSNITYGLEYWEGADSN